MFCAGSESILKIIFFSHRVRLLTLPPDSATSGWGTVTNRGDVATTDEDGWVKMGVDTNPL